MYHQNRRELAEHREPTQPDQRIQPHIARPLIGPRQTEHAIRPDMPLNVAVTRPSQRACYCFKPAR